MIRQNCSIDWQELLSPSAPVGPPGAGYSGPCPETSWVFLKRKTPQSLWTTFARPLSFTVNKCFLIFKGILLSLPLVVNNFSCPLILLSPSAFLWLKCSPESWKISGFKSGIDKSIENVFLCKSFLGTKHLTIILQGLTKGRRMHG